MQAIWVLYKDPLTVAHNPSMHTLSMSKACDCPSPVRGPADSNTPASRHPVYLRLLLVSTRERPEQQRVYVPQ